MSTPTTARPTHRDSAHWYETSGRARHEVERADKKGMRATTLKDARKLNLLPSVTNILKLLHKEALVNWQIEQAVLAVITTPRQPGEQDDAFAHRVLQVEQVQHQERNIARDKGVEIHDGLEYLLAGMQADEKLYPWIAPAAEAIKAFGAVTDSELNLVGYGYAGRTDLIQDAESHWCMTDYKGSKKLPDPNKGGAWMEHRLQLAAYAKAFQRHTRKLGLEDKPIILRNIYISTLNEGEFVMCEHTDPWEDTYKYGFAPLVTHWQWANGYKPDLKGLEDEIEQLDQAEAAAAKPDAFQEATDKANARLNKDVIAEPQPAQPAPVVTTIKGRRVVISEGMRVNPQPYRQ